jgi:hypothetical protein
MIADCVSETKRAETWIILAAKVKSAIETHYTVFLEAEEKKAF